MESPFNYLPSYVKTVTWNEILGIQASIFPETNKIVLHITVRNPRTISYQGRNVIIQFSKNKTSRPMFENLNESSNDNVNYRVAVKGSKPFIGAINKNILDIMYSKPPMGTIHKTSNYHSETWLVEMVIIGNSIEMNPNIFKI
jgi:hypothetical protein